MTNNNNKHRVFCVIGRTGSGKTKIVKQAARELDMKVLSSYTTRKPRTEELESESADHIFVNDLEFADLLEKEEFIAYTEIDNARYFATLNQLKENDFYVIDPSGYEYLKNNVDLDLFELVPVYINTFFNNRKQRYMDRNNATEDAFLRRDNSERAQFDIFVNEFYFAHKLGMGDKSCNCIIDNNNAFEDAVGDFELFVLETIKSNK